MQLGIFAKTFIRPTLGETLDAVVNHGLNYIQFNFSCVGLPTLPERIDAALIDHIRREVATRRLTMAAVSGTCNLIHPDLAQRQDALLRLKVLIAVVGRVTPCAPQAGLDDNGAHGVTRPTSGLMGKDRVRGQSPVITLCTGTRDPDDLWRRHPENATPEAWRDLVTSLGEALPVAEASGVTLAFEPEISNVVDSARKGRRLLEEMKSMRLKVVMDGANLFQARELPRMKEILNEAFDLLGPDIGMAHAKDLNQDGAMGNVAAGKGVLDYELYLSLLDGVGFRGPLILHGLEEKEVPECIAFLRGKMEITR